MARNAVAESRRLRKATTYPDIAIYLDVNPRADNIIDLVIHNIGTGAASNVRFQVPNNPVPFSGMPASEAYALEHGLNYMPPGRELRYLLNTAGAIPKDEFTVAVSYAVPGPSSDQERLSGVYTLRPREFDGMMYLTNAERQAQKSLKAAMDALARGKVRITLKGKDESSPH